MPWFPWWLFRIELDVVTGCRTGCSIMNQPILINERFLKKIPGGRSNLNGDAGTVECLLQIVLAVWMLMVTAKMFVTLHRDRPMHCGRRRR